MTFNFSTATLDRRAQLDYWREVVCTTFVEYEMDVPRGSSSGFLGQVTAQTLGGLGVARVISDPHTVFRSPALIRRSGDDDFLVNLAVRGSVTVIQQGRDAVLRPGDFTVYDSARPCRIVCGDPFELLVLKVPRPLFDAHCPLARDAMATPVPGDQGVGALFAPFFRSVSSHASALSLDVSTRIGATLLELLATALYDESDSDGRLGAPRTAHMSRARRYIADHIAEPDLSPDMVAQALGISVRYLHAIFRNEDTSPSRWIQGQRLDIAARLLADPGRTGRTVTDIAYAVGFKDASHFTRAFKSRHGVSPREYRRDRSAVPGGPAA
ncbi:helix-turn-helix domain-containing protein [Streptomyces sp. A012304]|uniref:AraC-like ligand-binding domain-containing protein n=1 Tax=Streptomyces sp. A012304 TaxID=375446 RepID=UPI00222ED9D8|nr:helix-turn-helix domain-containing protein [Streptomyces sp. A012304]GKQ39208.1 AraC family transcriptional regulator [Streptomyces sp. A012304]